MVLQESERELERGDRAPDFSLPGADGETYSRADFADRDALLITFTCNHCPYAKAKIDALNGLAADYEDVAVIGINPNDADAYPEDSFERMEAVVEEGIVEYDAYLRDEAQDIARAYGATCTPDPFLFANDDAAGDTGFQLAYHGRLDDATGPEERASGEPGFEMRAAIDRVLAGEEVAETFRPSRGCSIKWN
ncbi:thioredoxin family protein [Halobacteriales archaeon QS_3_64_16]|nr:MAG: thioredoxin family protein [Halobacteriales archaeon QS_3_64_16]